MTVPAIGQVIHKDKCFKYLYPFIKLMREGGEVPFTDEKVATRRIYKDGERVKKILSIYDNLIDNGIEVRDNDILKDLFQKVPPGSIEKKDNYPWREIEYQSIADPKKTEVLSINKIGKQVLTGRGGILTAANSRFDGKESDWTETLTCYALALRQSKGSDITVEEFKAFLLSGANENSATTRIVNSFVVTNKDKSKVYDYGIQNVVWQTSAVKVSNALYASPYLKSGIQYDFYFGGATEIKWFKSKWNNKFNSTLQNHLRQLNNISNDAEKYGSSVDDKWNPADIFAVAKNLNKQELETTTMSFFPGTIKDYKKFTGKNRIRVSDEKAQADMAELTRYNSWIHERIVDGTLIPISLKKVAGVAKVNLISNPSIEDFKIDISNIKVTWETTAAKIYIYFDVTYTMQVAGTNNSVKKHYEYFFDCRNFNVGENVQFELGAANSAAKHGKVSVGPAEMIIDMSSQSIRTHLQQSRKNYIKLMRTPNLRTKIFPNLTAAIPETTLKSFEDNVVNKSRPNFFVNNSDIDAIVLNSGWPSLLGNYIKFISKEFKYDLNKNDRELKNYFKSKIAAVELGWVMTNKKVQPIIKNNILKSLYLYASSQGLTIFDDSGLLKKSYFYNSSYIKVRD